MGNTLRHINSHSDIPNPISFRRRLMAWYDRCRRRLPWRERPSLYSTVVSELMLQQTQVKTVLPYFEAWMRTFPDFAALARAPESAVLRAWSGLGYYARARNLHRLAKEIGRRNQPPRTATEWREMPGIGPYTSAAIASIASGERVACVDGNVVRVLARLSGDQTSFAGSQEAARRYQAVADRLLSPRRPGDFNQAMMELGATVCLPRRPLCASCPVRSGCRAARDGTAEKIPSLVRKKTKARLVWRAWCIRNKRILLRQAANGRQLSGLYELPDALACGWNEKRLAQKEPLAIRRRTITRHRIEERIVALPPPKRRANAECKWIAVKDLPRTPLSGPHKRWIAELLEQRIER